MTDDGGIALVEHRSGVEDRFCGPEDGLHFPELAVGEGDGEHRQGAVGAQHVEAVELGIIGDACRVDLEMAAACRLEEVPIAGIAEQRLVAVGELVGEAFEGSRRAWRHRVRHPWD